MARGTSVDAGNPFPHYECGPAADHLMKAHRVVSAADILEPHAQAVALVSEAAAESFDFIGLCLAH
jgi:hypothetical protein